MCYSINLISLHSTLQFCTKGTPQAIVLLRERKRHTAAAAVPPSSPNGGGGSGGTPHSSPDGWGGGTPYIPNGGVPVPHLPDGGTPPTSVSQMGVHCVSQMVYPPSARWGTALPLVSQVGVAPIISQMRYLLSARWGASPIGWMGVPPSPKCEQTDTCENSTFPIPSEYGR